MNTHPIPLILKRRRRLDIASLLLMLVGIVCAATSGWLIVEHGHHVALLIPSVFAVITGAQHLSKWEAREHAIDPSVTTQVTKGADR